MSDREGIGTAFTRRQAIKSGALGVASLTVAEQLLASAATTRRSPR